jgi:hypothetical protein
MTEQVKKNPYAETGAFLTEAEFNILVTAVAMFTEHAIKQGNTEAVRPARSLIVRLNHVIHAGEGLSAEQTQGYGAEIAKAMAYAASGADDGDDVLTKTIGAYLAACIRTEADPAERVGLVCAQMVRHGANEIGKHIGLGFMNKLAEILTEAGVAWERDGWTKATAKEQLQWIMDLLGFGAENIAAGQLPWPDDPPAEADPPVSTVPVSQQEAPTPSPSATPTDEVPAQETEADPAVVEAATTG